MSKRNALLVAVVAVILLAVLFLWPERARADFAASARIGGGFGVHSVGGRLHHGDGGFRGRGHVGSHGRSHLGVHGRAHVGSHGRAHLGAGDFRGHGAVHSGRHHGRHGALLGDRFRAYQHRRIGGGHAKGALIGDRFRVETLRRLDREFLGPEHRSGRHARGHDGHASHDGQGYRHEGHGRKYGHRRYGHGKYGYRARHRGKWLGPEHYLLPYGGADVIVREVVVPVPVPVSAERRDNVSQARALDPRGRARLVGEEDGVIGDWAEGDVLPADVPHVTLDPDAYDLPEPPLGEKYARVGNDVLRIDAGSRRITEVVAR